MEHLKNEVESWAAMSGQTHVTIEISSQFFRLGGSDSVRLYPFDINGPVDLRVIHNNRQQIFRWLRSDSKAARGKLEALKPAILSALPAERRARIEGISVNYVVSLLLRDVSTAITSVLLNDRNIAWHIQTIRNSLDELQKLLIDKHKRDDKWRD